MSNILPVFDSSRDAVPSSRPENDMAIPSTHFDPARDGGGTSRGGRRGTPQRDTFTKGGVSAALSKTSSGRGFSPSPSMPNWSRFSVVFAVTFNLVLVPIRAIETIVPPPPIPNSLTIPPTRVGVPFLIRLTMARHEALELSDQAIDELAKEATVLLQEDNTREEGGTLLVDFSCPTRIERIRRDLTTFGGPVPQDILNKTDFEALVAVAANFHISVIFVREIVWCGTGEDDPQTLTFEKDILGCRTPGGVVFMQTSPRRAPAVTLAHEVGHLGGIEKHAGHPSKVMYTAETENPSGIPSSPTERDIVSREECKFYLEASKLPRVQ